MNLRVGRIRLLSGYRHVRLGEVKKVQINVSQLLKSNIGTVRKYEVDTTVDVDGSERRFQGNIRLMRTDRGILAKGVFQTELTLYCSRCLTGFIHPLTITVEEEYFPTMDVVTGISLPEPDDPGSFTIDDHNILDLSEAIRQYTLLAVPIKPLCRRDCAGLCSSCGANLNERTCDCPAPVDPIWAKLGTLVLTDNDRQADN
jgi:uncharacterized protein